MAIGPSGNPGRGALRAMGTLGGRTAALTLRPLSGVIGAGMGLERRAVDRLLDSGEVERLLASARLQALFAQALESDGARLIVDALFDSGVFDRIIERLLASESLWRLVDEVASSPAVTAAISQQGLGFADQVAGELRTRSRNADGWLERRAGRLAHRRHDPRPGEPDADA